jgi:hypothetical protein
MLRQVLRLMGTVLGKEHPSTLGSMANLGNVLRKRGKYEQTLRLRTVMLGKEHSAMVGSMNNLGLSKLFLEPRRVTMRRPNHPPSDRSSILYLHFAQILQVWCRRRRPQKRF